MSSNTSRKVQGKKKQTSKPKKKTVQQKVVISSKRSTPGERLGKSVGGFLGKAAESVIGSIFGLGDYKVNYNSLTAVGGPPQFSNNGSHRSTVITHREFVSDITGSSGFSLASYSLNPTNVTLFPWLSQIAANYEEYRIHGMIFEFKTTSGQSVSSTNTALGTVIMSTQYNANDSPFASKLEMENYEFSTSGGPFENFMHPVECKPGLTVAPELYVSQPGTGGAVVDRRLTDFGNFSIATVGMQAANVVGELWVSYQIELLKPRLSSIIEGPGALGLAFSGTFTSASNLRALGDGTPTSSNPVPCTSGVYLPYVQYASTSSSNSLNTLRTTNTLTNTTPIVVYGNSNANGLYLPYSQFTGRKVLLTIIWNGSGMSGIPTVTVAGVVSTLNTQASAATSSATQAIFSQAYTIGSAIADSSATAYGVTFTVTCPNLGGTTTANLFLTVLA